MHMFARSFVDWPPADDDPIVPTHATTGSICTHISFDNCIQVTSASRALAFFLLHAAKVRSSCEERGPGQSALQSAYHDPKLDVTELKQHRTP